MKKLALLLIALMLPALSSAQSINVNALPNGSTPVAGDYTICDQSNFTNKCPFSQVALSVSNILGLGNFSTASYPAFVNGDCLSNNGSVFIWTGCGAGGGTISSIGLSTTATWLTVGN